MNLRAQAASVIHQVIVNGRSLSDCLPHALLHFKDKRDQAFLQALSYGVCRWYFRLDVLAQKLLTKPLKSKDQDVYCLLLVGLYQLNEMRVAVHAAVAETVAAANALKKPWAKNLINAVLRNFERQKIILNAQLEQDPVAFYSHPVWIMEEIQHAWPAEWRDVLNANNQFPPFALRINQNQITLENYLNKLQGKIPFLRIPETKTGIILENAMDVQELPGFNQGEISVQDGAAQLAAELLEVQSAQYVLDACAAPGGKTAHLLELQPDIELVAVDHDEKRLQKIKDNLTRLKLSATTLCADAAESKTWWNGKLFDRILLDVPCSASGVIRRHPDIKLLRRKEDIVKLREEQVRLLNGVWNLLKPGGLLVYASCSIFPKENVSILEHFLSMHPEAAEEKIRFSVGKTCAVGKQILPGMQSMDGFYFARLRRK